jgi:hypothetical protein
MTIEHSRRTMFKQLAGVAAGAALICGGSGLLAPTVAQAVDVPWSEPASANGWSIPTGHSSFTATYDIPGSGLAIPLREGDAGTVLSYLAQRFNYDVARLEKKRGEIVGYSADRNIEADFESNHLSGTALALYPESYPLGVKGNFFPLQIAAIRDILAELEGVAKWGGDMEPAKESTFFIDVPPDSKRLKQVAAKLREWQITPGEGAGTQHIEDPKRLTVAKKLAQKQAE